jgi:hypothetical protein
MELFCYTGLEPKLSSTAAPCTKRIALVHGPIRHEVQPTADFMAGQKDFKYVEFFVRGTRTQVVDAMGKIEGW